ncbi:uncharacterized protein LOC136043944 isoform X1 [Artemia franciscana]|uniref:uncharacterized protein LOC136043944 isoform X1 n=1 Tax=Artemia franciscana TaxID=6661 RepID=UPI0032DA63F2
MEGDTVQNSFSISIPNGSPENSSIMNNIADELDSASQAPGTIGSDRAVSAADRIFNLAYNCDVKKINDICQDIDLSETNQFGANVLHCLIRSKKQDKKKDTYWALMKRLSNDEQKKSLITQNDNDGYSPLDKAAFEGDSITLKLMLKTILNLSTEIPKIQKDRTLLHSAAAGGHISSLRIILEEAGKAWRKKTDKAMLKNKIQTFLDEQDLDGNTALHLAAIYRHWSAVDFLIDRGCSLTILNNKGDPPLNYCLKLSRSNESLIKRLDSSIQYITRRQDHRVKRTKLKMNFTTLVSHDKGSHKLGRETSCESYIVMLVQHLDEKHAKEILFHPLWQTFVELKLQRLRGYCILNLLFYLFLLGFFTSFCFSNTSPTTNIDTNRTTNFTANFNGNNAEFTLAILSTLFIIPCLLSSFIFLIFYLFSHFQCCTKQNARETISGKIGGNKQIIGETRESEERILLNEINIDLVNQSDYLHSSFKLPIYNCKVRLLSCFYNLIVYCWIIKIIWGDIGTPSEKAFILFGLWFIFLKKIKVFSSPGLYVMVFYKVAYSFLKLFAVFSSLFLGFIFALQLLQKVPYGFIANSAIGLAMISGEYGYSEKYALLEDGFAKSLFLIVVFLLGIVLMAVFIGLSVRDASLLLNEGRYHLTKKNIQMIFIAEDFGKWLEALGICFVSEQLSIFNNLEEPSIEVSLKQATRKDLLFESKKWFQAHVQYYLFKIFGVTLQRSLLYRKFPISKILQDEIETFLVTKTPSQESFDPNSQI